MKIQVTDQKKTHPPSTLPLEGKVPLPDSAAASTPQIDPIEPPFMPEITQAPSPKVIQVIDHLTDHEGIPLTRINPDWIQSKLDQNDGNIKAVIEDINGKLYTLAQKISTEEPTKFTFSPQDMGTLSVTDEIGILAEKPDEKTIVVNVAGTAVGKSPEEIKSKGPFSGQVRTDMNYRGEETTISDHWDTKDTPAELEKMVNLANEVADRIRSGENVLIHCVAGQNRSVTVTTMVMMLLHEKPESMNTGEHYGQMIDRVELATNTTLLESFGSSFKKEFGDQFDQSSYCGTRKGVTRRNNVERLFKEMLSMSPSEDGPMRLSIKPIG